MFYSTFYCLLPLSVMILLLILKSGDVHPNPGPPHSESSDSWSSSLDLYNFLNLPNHLSTIHYIVQSIANKLDTLIAEFSFLYVRRRRDVLCYHPWRAGGVPHSLSGAYLQDYASYGYKTSWVDRSHQGRVQCTGTITLACLIFELLPFVYFHT